MEKLKTDIKLKNCPFCGSPGEGHEYRVETGGGISQFIARVQCSATHACPMRCCVTAAGHDSYSRGERTDQAARMKAVIAWNQRVI